MNSRLSFSRLPFGDYICPWVLCQFIPYCQLYSRELYARHYIPETAQDADA